MPPYAVSDCATTYKSTRKRKEYQDQRHWWFDISHIYPTVEMLLKHQPPLFAFWYASASFLHPHHFYIRIISGCHSPMFLGWCFSQATGRWNSMARPVATHPRNCFALRCRTVQNCAVPRCRWKRNEKMIGHMCHDQLVLMIANVCWNWDDRLARRCLKTYSHQSWLPLLDIWGFP